MMHFRKKEKFIDIGVFFARETSSGLCAPFYGKKQAYHGKKTV